QGRLALRHALVRRGAAAAAACAGDRARAAHRARHALPAIGRPHRGEPRAGTGALGARVFHNRAGLGTQGYLRHPSGAEAARTSAHSHSSPPAMHIAIAGNIGSGKTTLTQLLAKHYKWEQLQEAVDNNPYLFDFYKDMQRWSFNLQIFFLNSRFEQLLEIRRSGLNVIQDRTIYEDAYIFAPNLHAMGLMTTRDF